jgi:putative flippase GtrA
VIESTSTVAPGRVPPAQQTARNAGAFAAAGATGLVVNTLALAVFAGRFHLHYLLGVCLATQCSTLWNFLLVDRLVFASTGGSLRAMARRYLQFSIVNNVALLLRGPMVVLMVSGLGAHYLLANVASLGVLFVGRYFVADKWIWRDRAEPALQPTRG